MTKGVKIAKITENDSQEQRISKLNSNFQNLLAASMRLDKLGILCNRNKKQTDEVAADAVAAQTAADSAQQSAKDAKTAANNAQIMADAAQSSANEAAAAASNAQTTADNAAKDAREANEKAQSAATDAAKANIDLSEVKAEVTNIKADSVTLRSDLEGQIETVTTTMETDYAKKTDLSDTKATLRTEISTSAAGITQTVSETYAKKTDVTDAIITAKADLQTQITQNAESISLTAKSVEQAKVDIKENATNITEAKNAAATAQSTANAAKTDAAEAATAAENAQSAADAANTAASNAQTKANEAATAAATAKTAADKAKTDLATAQAKLAEVEANANATAEDLATAQQAVETAQAAADAAQDAANTAQANAATAKSTADTAKANAEAAQTTANTAKTNAENAKKAAEDAQASAKAANDALAVLEPRVTAAETAIEQNAEEITLRATKTEVTALENRVTTAESKITSDAIVNTVKGSSQFQAAGDYVTGTEAYSQLKQTVSSINGEVFNSDGSSKLEQTASSLTSQINGKQDKGDYVTGTAEYSQLKQTVSGINSTVQSHSGSISNLQQTAEGIQVRLDNQQTVRNLVSKSRLLDGWGYVVSAGVTVSKNVSTSAPELGEVTVARFNASTANSSDQSSYIHMTNAARVTSGSKYTLSVWARKVSGGNARPRLSLSTTNQSAIIAENLTTEWKRYSYKFTLGTVGTGKYVDITTSFGVSVLSGQTGVFEVCCPQLEAGDTMNPWSANSVDATDYMGFTEAGLVVGDMTDGTLGPNVCINAGGVHAFYEGCEEGVKEIAHLGYGNGNSESGTSTAPYYTLGTRKEGSAVGNYSVAEGKNNNASALCSHAEGSGTTASHCYSHAEGASTTASGMYSHAEGCKTTASGMYSHAQNYGTIASSPCQTAIGMYNVEHSDSKYAFIIGNGQYTYRSDAFKIDWDGNVYGGSEYTLSNEYDGTNTFYRANRTDKNRNVAFGIGSGGSNAGFYDSDMGKWIVYSNGTNAYLNGACVDVTSSTSASTFFTLNSTNVTSIESAYVAKWGELCMVYVCVKMKVALSAGDISNKVIGTLKSGYRPKILAALTSGATGPVCAFYANTSGEVSVVATHSAVSAGSSISFGGTFILA